MSLLSFLVFLLALSPLNNRFHGTLCPILVPLRPLTEPPTGQGFLLVFSITSLSSLRELSHLREDIIRVKDTTAVPLVIVGNKSDLEDDRSVSRAKAFGLSQEWGNAPYYETSARRRTNVDEVFVDLCRQIIRKDLDTRARGGAGLGLEVDDDLNGEKNGFRRRERMRSYSRRRRSRGSRDRLSCVIL